MACNELGAQDSQESTYPTSNIILPLCVYVMALGMLSVLLSVLVSLRSLLFSNYKFPLLTVSMYVFHFACV